MSCLTKKCRKARKEADPVKAAAKTRAYSKKWRENNRDKYLEIRRNSSRRRYQKHKAKHNATCRAWYERNKARCMLALSRRHKIARHYTIVPLPVWEDIVATFGGLCAYCSSEWEERDHVVPVSRGGQHCSANLVPACRKCNRSKFNKFLREWRPKGIRCAA